MTQNGIMAQRFSPAIPWVLIGEGADFAEVYCEVCSARGFMTTAEDINAFAFAHREHTAGEDYFGLGDAVAAMAKPFQSAPCTPCEARRRALNQIRVRRPW
jgi:hypothetical protein